MTAAQDARFWDRFSRKYAKSPGLRIKADTSAPWIEHGVCWGRMTRFWNWAVEPVPPLFGSQKACAAILPPTFRRR